MNALSSYHYAETGAEGRTRASGWWGVELTSRALYTPPHPVIMSFLAKRPLFASNVFKYAAAPAFNSSRHFSVTSPAMSTLAEIKQNCRKVRQAGVQWPMDCR